MNAKSVSDAFSETKTDVFDHSMYEITGAIDTLEMLRRQEKSL